MEQKLIEIPKEKTGFFTSDFVFSLADPLPWFAYSIGCTRKYKTEMDKRSR